MLETIWNMTSWILSRSYAFLKALVHVQPRLVVDIPLKYSVALWAMPPSSCRKRTSDQPPDPNCHGFDFPRFSLSRLSYECSAHGCEEVVQVDNIRVLDIKAYYQIILVGNCHHCSRFLNWNPDNYEKMQCRRSGQRITCNFPRFEIKIPCFITSCFLKWPFENPFFGAHWHNPRPEISAGVLKADASLCSPWGQLGWCWSIWAMASCENEKNQPELGWNTISWKKKGGTLLHPNLGCYISVTDPVGV